MNKYIVQTNKGEEIQSFLLKEQAIDFWETKIEACFILEYKDSPYGWDFVGVIRNKPCLPQYVILVENRVIGGFVDDFVYEWAHHNLKGRERKIVEIVDFRNFHVKGPRSRG